MTFIEWYKAVKGGEEAHITINSYAMPLEMRRLMPVTYFALRAMAQQHGEAVFEYGAGTITVNHQVVFG